ncbi:phage holin family protein [Cellulomonas hominis]
MTTTGGGRPHGPRFFQRLTEPLTDRARERFEHVEDKVRGSIQSEIDAVTRSVRAKAVEVRPSALLFGAAALLTVFGLALFITAAVVGLAAAVPLWLSALLVGLVLLLVATAFAAWGRHRLPRPVRVAPAADPVPPDVDELIHPWTD